MMKKIRQTASSVIIAGIFAILLMLGVLAYANETACGECANSLSAAGVTSEKNG